MPAQEEDTRNPSKTTDFSARQEEEYLERFADLLLDMWIRECIMRSNDTDPL